MTTLYIYEAETMVLVARIEGSSNEACESVAAEQYGDTDSYGWTYSPAFGANDGLKPGENVIDIEA